MGTKAVSIRLDEEELRQIDELAAQDDRSRNWWINQVIHDALAREEAWRKEIERRLEEADAHPERMIPHEEVMMRMREKFDLT